MDTSSGPGPLQDRFNPLLLLCVHLGVALAAAKLIFEYHSCAAYHGSLNDLVFAAASSTLVNVAVVASLWLLLWVAERTRVCV